MTQTSSSTCWFSGVLPEYWDDLYCVQSQVNDPMLQKLFRIFLMLAERSFEKSNNRKSVLWIHADEINLLASILAQHLPAVRRCGDSSNPGGCSSSACHQGFYHFGDSDGVDLIDRRGGAEDSSKMEYTFREFATVLSRMFPYDRREFVLALLIVYDHLINQVLKKGFLLWSSRKPWTCLHTWQRRWVVIKPGLITFYKDQDENEKLKDVSLSSDIIIEVIDQANGSPLCDFELRSSTSGKRRFAATFDTLQRRQWITALQYASRNSPLQQQPSPTNSAVSSANIHRRAFLKRRELRIAKASQQQDQQSPARANGTLNPQRDSPEPRHIPTESAPGSSSSRDDCLRLAEDPVWTSLTAEALRKELTTERSRANRLGSEKLRLLDQLENQRLAIKDEEIVRSLATRLFEEEQARRNSLEDMNRRFSEQIDEERRKRHDVEFLEMQRQAEIRRLKDELQKLQNRLGTSNLETSHPQNSSEVERLEMIAKLKRDQESLIKHHSEIRNEFRRQQQDCTQRFEEAKSILNKLLENSKKRSLPANRL